MSPRPGHECSLAQKPISGFLWFRPVICGSPLGLGAPLLVGRYLLDEHSLGRIIVIIIPHAIEFFSVQLHNFRLQFLQKGKYAHRTPHPDLQKIHAFPNHKVSIPVIQKDNPQVTLPTSGCKLIFGPQFFMQSIRFQKIKCDYMKSFDYK